jgi:hypothetical protein
MIKLNKLRRGRHLNPMPMTVTINDCLLLWQMGYRVEINDGRVVEIRKEKKR